MCFMVRTEPGRGVGLPGTRARCDRSARSAPGCARWRRYSAPPCRLVLSSYPPSPGPSLAPPLPGQLRLRLGEASEAARSLYESSECHQKSLPPCQHFSRTPAALHLCLFSLSLHRSPVRKITQRRPPGEEAAPAAAAAAASPAQAARAASAFKETGSIFQNSWVEGRLLCPRALGLPLPPCLLQEPASSCSSSPPPTHVRGAPPLPKGSRLSPLLS